MDGDGDLLLFLSTSDTDLLALQACSLPDGFGRVEAHNPARVTPEALDGLVQAVERGR